MAETLRQRFAKNSHWFYQQNHIIRDTLLPLTKTYLLTILKEDPRFSDPKHCHSNCHCHCLSFPLPLLMRWWNLFYEKYPEQNLFVLPCDFKILFYHYRHHQIWQFTACCNLCTCAVIPTQRPCQKIATIPKPWDWLLLGKSAPVKRLPLRLISMPMVIISLLQVKTDWANAP